MAQFILALLLGLALLVWAQRDRMRSMRSMLVQFNDRMAGSLAGRSGVGPAV